MTLRAYVLLVRTTGSRREATGSLGRSRFPRRRLQHCRRDGCPAVISAPRPVTGRRREAGILAPGSLRSSSFPRWEACQTDSLRPQWIRRRPLAGHSCGGSRGFTPRSDSNPFREPCACRGILNTRSRSIHFTSAAGRVWVFRRYRPQPASAVREHSSASPAPTGCSRLRAGCQALRGRPDPRTRFWHQ